MSPLPYLTPHLPGLGGQLKSTPADFIVEEVPAYEPSGSGEHLFLWIEKEDLAAEELLRRIARTVGISRQDIGVAGMKDRQAITRQWISIPARQQAALDHFDDPHIRILRRVLHSNKLKTGHLRGNRFEITLRDVAPNALELAAPIVTAIQQQGFPNYYGDQRFGHDDNTAELGFDLLLGQQSPKDIPYGRRKFLLRLALSAAQSRLFNNALAARLTRGDFSTVLTGDVMEVIASGGKFLVEDQPAEQLRFNQHETSITGPMFGPKMKSPTGPVLALEEHLLAAAGLTRDAFSAWSHLTEGTRRPYRILAPDLTLTSVPDGLGVQVGLRVDVSLPSGVYATTLLRELMKSPPSE